MSCAGCTEVQVTNHLLGYPITMLIVDWYIQRPFTYHTISKQPQPTSVLWLAWHQHFMKAEVIMVNKQQSASCLSAPSFSIHFHCNNVS